MGEKIISFTTSGMIPHRNLALHKQIAFITLVTGDSTDNFFLPLVGMQQNKITLT
jgi:hypothetical protein